MGFSFILIALLSLTLTANGFAASAHEKKKPPAPTLPTVVSLDPTKWAIRYSYEMPPRPSTSPYGAWHFDFPKYPDASVHYVTTPYGGAMSGKSFVLAVDIRFVSGTPKFNWTEGGFSPNPCDTPAHVRPYFETKRFSGEFDRWWSKKGIVLQPGVQSITVPLTGTNVWGSVYGKSNSVAPSQFSAAMSNVAAVGMTFGGGCFYGHGVNVMNGSVDFILKDYGVR